MKAIDFVLDTLSHYARADDGPPPGVPTHVGSGFEKALIRLCRQPGLSTIVWDSLEKLTLLPKLSRTTTEYLKSLSNTEKNMSSALNRSLNGLVQSLGEDVGRVLFVNDVLLGSDKFRGSGRRPLQRLEIIVRQHDWDRVMTRCDAAGFHWDHTTAWVPNTPQLSSHEERFLFFQYYFPCVLRNGEGHTLLLRSRLFDFGNPDVRETAWDRATAISVGDSEAMSVSVEDQLIQSCINYNSSHFRLLRHAADTGELYWRFKDTIDWNHVQTRLQPVGLYPSFYLTFKRVLDWLKMGACPRALPAPGVARKQVFNILWRPYKARLSKKEPVPFGRIRFNLLEQGKLVDKVNLLFKLISPRRTWISDVYGEEYHPWLRWRFVAMTFKNRIGV